MADRTWVDMLRRQTRELGGLQDAHAAEFLRLVRETKAGIVDRLSSGQDGSIDAFQLQRVLGEVEVNIKALTGKAVSGYTSQQRAAVEAAIEHQAETIGRLSGAMDERPFSVALDAQKVLADPSQGLLANHFESSVQRYGLDVINDVRRDLFVGLRTGSSLSDITRKIASQKGPLGELGQANAARLARTELSQAYGAASLESGKQAAQQVPGMIKTWMHIGSFKCPVCNPLHGTKRPMDGSWTIRRGSKDREIAGPPAHPNCTCRLLFGRDKWRTAMQERGYLERQDPNKSPDTSEAKPLPLPRETLAEKIQRLSASWKDQPIVTRPEDLPGFSAVRPAMKPPTLKEANAKQREFPGTGITFHEVDVSSLDDIVTGIRKRQSALTIAELHLKGKTADIDPISVGTNMFTGKREIVGGAHRLAVARALGIKRINVKFVR